MNLLNEIKKTRFDFFYILGNASTARKTEAKGSGEKVI